MVQGRHLTEVTDMDEAGEREPERWLGSPVTLRKGSLRGVGQHLPHFRRLALGLTQPGRGRSRLNGRLDLIVRDPIGQDMDHVPVGTVSRSYRLIQHAEVLETATRALEASGVDAGRVRAHLRLTELGERMGLSLMLPWEYAMDPGDGHRMALQVECVNSVDGSTRLRAMVGWFRFVCSNGLVVGESRLNVRRRHAHGISLDDLGASIIAAVAESETDRKTLKKWKDTPVQEGPLISWVNGTLARRWGPLAAARALHIALTGWDGTVSRFRRGLPPSALEVRPDRPVPGTPERARTLFDLSQVLAWLAKERKELSEQMEWRQEIPDLIRALG